MEAILKMRRALDEYVLTGITTNLRYLKQIMEHPEFVKGDYDTGFLPREHQKLLGEEDPAVVEASMIAAAVRAHQRAEHQQAQIAAAQARSGGSSLSPWRTAGRRQGSWKRG
jgi:acetyl-CoA carboxylase biotin carboxylase subunit